MIGHGGTSDECISIPNVYNYEIKRARKSKKHLGRTKALGLSRAVALQNQRHSWDAGGSSSCGQGDTGGQIGEAVDVGKQSLRQHLGGCKLANSKFGEAKKRILLQEEGDVMKEQVGVPASGKAVSLWG